MNAREQTLGLAIFFIAAAALLGLYACGAMS